MSEAGPGTLWARRGVVVRALAPVAVAVAATATALVVALAPGPDDRPGAPEPEQVPISSDRDVLAAAADGTLLGVERDPDGQLVMLVRPGVDPLTLEQRYPAPPAPVAGTTPILALGAALALLAAVSGWTGRGGAARAWSAAAVGLFGATAAVGAALGAAPAPSWVALGCALLLAAAAVSGYAFSR